jgi:hypothetical protein
VHTQLLAREASNPRGYGIDILAETFGYGQDEESDRLLFPVKLQAARLHRKRVVYGVKVGGQAVAVDAEWLTEQGSWSHEMEAGLLSLETSEDGGALASLDGSPIAAHRMFWFAWYSFNPQTALISSEDN